MLKPYSSIASIYDYLMRSVDYKSWADYLVEIHKLSNPKSGKILELGTGTGKLSNYLSEKFNTIICTDLSVKMLKMNKNVKSYNVACDMTNLPFKNDFSFIYSCFDTINYILSSEKLRCFFIEIEKILTDEGCFAFDVSLINNSLNHQASLNRTGTINGINFEQKSIYSPTTGIHTNEFMLFVEGQVFIEVHKQKIYNLIEYFEILGKTNLYVENCFNSFTFDDADSESERVQFILKKKK